MLTLEEQLIELTKPVEQKYLRTATGVKGRYTTGDYVRWKLNHIFGPNNWSHTILRGPEIVTLNESNAYVVTIIRLTVQFADGQQVIHEDIGTWPLTARKDENLSDASPERYETIMKAVVTDALKACSEYLGICFRPLADSTLETHLRRKRDDDGQSESSSQSEGKTEEKKSQLESDRGNATEFWRRFNDLAKKKLILPTLRDAPELKQFITKGNFVEAISWLEAQVKKND